MSNPALRCGEWQLNYSAVIRRIFINLLLA